MSLWSPRQKSLISTYEFVLRQIRLGENNETCCHQFFGGLWWLVNMQLTMVIDDSSCRNEKEDSIEIRVNMI
jgi:hypothetical protein